MNKPAITMIILGILTFTYLPATAADGFHCPLPSNSLDPSRLERLKGLLPDVNTITNVEKLSATIDGLRREGIQKTAIIDHLLGTYCPMIAREVPLTDSAKVALVQRFTGQVTRLVYSLESGLEVIVNVPLTPDIIDAVNTAARKQGLSTQGWIAVTIDNALSQTSP